MTTLFQRLAGLTGPDDEPINASAFIAMVFQFKKGRVTAGDAIATFGLTPEQVTDAQRVVQSINASPDVKGYVDEMMGWIELAQSAARYENLPAIFVTESEFWNVFDLT